MNMAPRTYERLKNRGKITVVKDPDNPTTHVLLTRQRYDEDTDTFIPVSESVALAEIQDIRQKTHQERNRLDEMITDITAVLTAP